MAKTQEKDTSAVPADEFDFAPGWMPEDGDRLLGTLVERQVGEGEFGKYIILTMRPDPGQLITVRIGGRDSTPQRYETTGDADDLVAVHCFGAVLDNAVRKVRPQIGQRYGFRKVGKQLRKGGNEDNPRDYFNNWQVRDFSTKSDDDIYGRSDEPTGGGDFNDEPPF